MAKNKYSSKRTRHIDVKHQVVSDAGTAGQVNIVYVGMESQHADILTKALERDSFEKHVRVIMNVD